MKTEIKETLGTICSYYKDSDDSQNCWLVGLEALESNPEITEDALKGIVRKGVYQARMNGITPVTIPQGGAMGDYAKGGVSLSVELTEEHLEYTNGETYGVLQDSLRVLEGEALSEESDCIDYRDFYIFYRFYVLDNSHEELKEMGYKNSAFSVLKCHEFLREVL